ncbi:hypothetical protein ACY2DA_05275 [Staphylococcus simulans]
MITVMRYKGNKASTTSNGNYAAVLVCSSKAPVELADANDNLEVTSEFEKGKIEPQAVKNAKYGKGACVFMNNDFSQIIASDTRKNQAFVSENDNAVIQISQIDNPNTIDGFKQIQKNKVKSVDVYVKDPQGSDNKVSNIGKIVAVSINTK